MTPYILNISKENWDLCLEYKSYGIKRRRAGGFSQPRRGDLLLARQTRGGRGQYGIRGVWYCVGVEQVTEKSFVPWKDGTYVRLIHFDPLVEEFKTMLCEDFRDTPPESSVIPGLLSKNLMNSVVLLWGELKEKYLRAIISFFDKELDKEVSYLGREQNLKQLLQDILRWSS